MIGRYRFYENGRLVGEQENLITDLGKRAILNYLAGITGNYAHSLVVGSSNVAAAATDKVLGMEWDRVPVLTISPDYANTLLIYKGRLNEASAGVIYEAGLTNEFSPESQYGSKMILDFDSGRDTWSAGTWVTANARVGSDMLRLDPAASATITASMADTFMDLSGYSNADEFKLAYNVGNSFSPSIFVRFHTDASNYFTYTIPSSTIGYEFATFNKGNFVATGTPDWANITSVSVSATAPAGGGTIVEFDALRITDKDNFTDSDSLISHAILGTPVTKTAGISMDIEYTLDLTL